MNGLLKQLLDASRARAEETVDKAAASRPSFRDAIAGRDELSVIAEFKRRSPSSPVLAPAAALAPSLQRYVTGGAHAVSVVTEPTRFGGALADVCGAAACCPLPILRKDFLVLPQQIEVAATAGASAVLLIARALNDASLDELLHAASVRGLDVLLECHDQVDLNRALARDVLIGINNRDLDTLRVDLGNVLRLLPQIPDDRVVVAESGYETAAQVREVTGRVDAVLVGTALMRGGSIASLVEQESKT